MTARRLSDEELVELERLSESAFKAPWVAHSFEIDCPCPNGVDCGSSHTCEEVDATEEYPWSANEPASGEPGDTGQCVVQIDVPGLETFAKSNAALIAAARNALPELLAEVRRLRAVEAAAIEALSLSPGSFDGPSRARLRAALDAATPER